MDRPAGGLIMVPAQADSGRLTGEVLSWLVRQACGEEVGTCQRNRGSGRVETAAGPRTVMVQTAVAGRPLSTALPGMSARQRRSAARSCGQVIARLHSVPVGGFYRRHADGSFEFADNAALQAADLANRLDNLRLLAGAGLLTQAEVHRVEGLLPEAVAARGDGPAVLCHGEMFPGHIFVATGDGEAVSVTALIDFGDACGGRPLDDLQSLCWEWPEVDRAALAAGYGPAPFWTDRGRRLALAQLRMLLGYTAHDLRVGQPADAQGYLAGLRAVLASLAIWQLRLPPLARGLDNACMAGHCGLGGRGGG